MKQDQVSKVYIEDQFGPIPTTLAIYSTENSLITIDEKEVYFIL